MSHREDVIQFLRKLSDAYLAQACDTGIEPWELATVLQNSITHGAKGLERTSVQVNKQMHALLGEGAVFEASVEGLHDPKQQEAALQILSPFIDAAIQLAVASFILLETLPLPNADDLMLNFMAFQEPRKRPN